MKIKEMMEIFEAGKQVAKPAYWKQKTIDINKIILVISGAVGILNMFDCSVCNLHLSSEQLIGIATGVMSIASIFNMGSTAATSTKVGLLKPQKPATVVDVKTSDTEVQDDEVQDVESSLADDIKRLQ
jgi:hypothetical protein